jgi:hypothetical protein
MLFPPWTSLNAIPSDTRWGGHMFPTDYLMELSMPGIVALGR